MVKKKRGSKLAGAVLALTLILSFVGSAVAFGESLDSIDTIKIDAMIADNGSWKSEGIFSMDEGKVVVGQHGESDDMGIGGYMKEKSKDQLLTLKAQLQLNKSGNADDNFVYFGMRAKDPSVAFYMGGTFYGFFVNASGTITLLEWVNGALVGNPADKVQSTLNDGEVHTITYGAVNTSSGLRVIFAADGKTLFDFIDPGKTTEAGYYSFFATQGSQMTLTTIEAVPEKPAASEEPAATAPPAEASDDEVLFEPPADEAAAVESTDVSSPDPQPTVEAEPQQPESTVVPAKSGSQANAAVANPKSGDDGIGLYVIVAVIAAIAVISMKVSVKNRPEH